MRLFLGVALPSEIRTAVAGVSDKCRLRVKRVAPRAVLRWVDPDNLHITLWFLGEVDEARASRLTGVLQEPFRTPAFEIQLNGLGAYPQTGSPRVIWLGIDRGREALVQVYQELAERLPALGFEPERRAYSPHLTLARVKEMRRSDAKVVRSAMTALPGPAGEFQVSAITLFHSRLSAKGSQYESVLRVPLE